MINVGKDLLEIASLSPVTPQGISKSAKIYILLVNIIFNICQTFRKIISKQYLYIALETFFLTFSNTSPKPNSFEVIILRRVISAF